MAWFQDTLLLLMSFLEKGGIVVQVIMVLALVLWLMMLERTWFLVFEAKKQMKLGFQGWRKLDLSKQWHSVMIRDCMVSMLKIRFSRRLAVIRSFIAVMPLLGLLGTVSGMIQVFDIMAEMGTGNARAMAAGISKATIPTMAGIVVALTSLYFITRLESLSKSYTEEYRLMLFHNVEDISEITAVNQKNNNASKAQGDDYATAV